MAPQGDNAVMTIFTSTSLFCIYAFYLQERYPHRLNFIYASTLIQLISLIFYFGDFNTTISFFACSSLPTSIYLLIANSFIVMKTKQKIKNIFVPILLFGCGFFLLTFINHNLEFRGVVPTRIGIGLSPYTLFSFFIIALLMNLKNTEFLKLNKLNLKFNPFIGLLFLLTNSSLSMLLLYCPSPQRFAVGIALQLIFLAIAYFIFFRPFVQAQNRYVTFCSWTKKIKTHDGQWIEPQQMFESLGLPVNHSIHPDEVVRLKSQILARRNKMN